MFDLPFLLLQAVWVAIGVTCLVIFALLLRDGVQSDVRAAQSRRPLPQINAAHVRHA